MSPLELILITAAVSVSGALLRFYCRPRINKLVLCLSAFILFLSLDTAALADEMPLLGGGLALLLSYSYSGYGVLVSIAGIGLLLPAASGYYWPTLTWTVIAGLGGMMLYRQQRHQRHSDELWQEQLYKQSRQYSILKEISIAMQSTMESGKLLHIVLTAITAGYGLGFNRALLFLYDEDGKRLRGEFGIGSMNEREGIRIWNNVVNDRMNLRDLFVRKEDKPGEGFDEQLNDVLKRAEIPQAGDFDHVVSLAIREQKPYLIRDIDIADPVQRLFAEVFGMTSFAVVPMINQDKPVGVIVVDNNINKRPLDIDGVDNMLPIAAQACIAIENVRLYERTQKLSITDGLTGLYNQRYYDEALRSCVARAEQEGMALALIMFDIDNFKRYNDTNGHLEGNNLLIVLGRLIASAAAERYVPCRFGGEEFVVLLPGASEDEAYQVADDIRSAVERHAFQGGETQPAGKVTISGGTSAYRSGMGVTPFIDEADRALYKAKANGKNRIVRGEGACAD